MRSGELKFLLCVVFMFCVVSVAGAVSESEESWIILERNRPEEALNRCQGHEGFLCRWVVAVAEVRTGGQSSGDDDPSRAARAFEGGDYSAVRMILEPMLNGKFSEQDQLQIRLHLAGCYLGTGKYSDAEKLVNQVVDQSRERRLHASLCYGLLIRGQLRVAMNQLDGARGDLQSSLNLCRRLETHSWAGEAALSMSDLSRAHEDLEDAVYWSEAALQFFRHGGNVPGQVQAMQMLGNGLCQLQECPEGETFIQEARELATLHGIPFSETSR